MNLREAASHADAACDISGGAEAGAAPEAADGRRAASAEEHACRSDRCTPGGHHLLGPLMRMHVNWICLLRLIHSSSDDACLERFAAKQAVECAGRTTGASKDMEQSEPESEEEDEGRAQAIKRKQKHIAQQPDWQQPSSGKGKERKRKRSHGGVGP